MTTTETSIEKSDISDDVWSCSMLNKVSTTLSASTDSSSENRFSLIAVSESEEECVNHIESARLCDNLYAVVRDTDASPLATTENASFAGGMTSSSVISWCSITKEVTPKLSSLKDGSGKIVTYEDSSWPYPEVVTVYSSLDFTTCRTLNRETGLLTSYT